jgi:hypothetical protein
VWNVVYKNINNSEDYDSYGRRYVGKPWDSILRFRHIYGPGRPVDEFTIDYQESARN